MNEEIPCDHQWTEWEVTYNESDEDWDKTTEQRHCTKCGGISTNVKWVYKHDTDMAK